MTATDEDVTVTVTVKRGELDAVAGKLGTRSDAETVLASVHGAEAFTELVTIAVRQLIDAGVVAASMRDHGVDLVLLEPSGGRLGLLAQIKAGPLASDLEPQAHRAGGRLSELALKLVSSGERRPGGSSLEGSRNRRRRRVVPTSEFMAEFKGLRPLDPDRFRADIDEGFDTELNDPYKRARG